MIVVRCVLPAGHARADALDVAVAVSAYPLPHDEDELVPFVAGVSRLLSLIAPVEVELAMARARLAEQRYPQPHELECMREADAHLRGLRRALDLLLDA